MSTPAGETTLVRAVAVGNRIILPATELAFVAELERIVGLGAQHLSPLRPNVLALGEVLGLPAAFTGQRARLLAATDALYRPFAETLARLAARHHTHLVATTLAPRVRRSDDPHDISRWGTRGAHGLSADGARGL